MDQENKKNKIKKKPIFQKSNSEQELLEYKAGWMRAKADYENLLKETEAKKKDYLDWSRRQILEEFIPIYDNFKKAFSMEFGQLDTKTENWKKGIEYIMKQFSTILSNHNIEEIKTIGEKFDPNFHEAVAEEEVDDKEKVGQIIKEVDSGYLLNKKVIKVAKVILAK